MAGKTIIRIQKDKDNPYVIMSKVPLEDQRLSWKAKGLLAYLLSLPDNWQIYETELVNHAKDGRDATRSALKELISAGYVKRERFRDEKGRLRSCEYTVLEMPVNSTTNGKSSVGKSNIGFSYIGEPNTTNIITKLNNDLTNKENKKNNIVPYAEIIGYLNKVCGTNYRPSSKSTQAHINARWREGFRLEDFKRVIDKKAAEWLHDPKMVKYLRPETLFGTKFESYLNEPAVPKARVKETPRYCNLPDARELYGGGSS